MGADAYESQARLEGYFGVKFKRFSKIEVLALVTADVEGSVDNARMRQICTLHAVDVTRLLQGLVGKNALVQEGQGRWSRYRLADTGRSEHKTRDSEHKPRDSEHKPTDSEHKPGTSEHSDDLMAIAAPARSQKRLQPAETERIILELCRGRWLTRNRLAELLGRHPDGLRSRFLTPLVAHERLRLRYPDKPNRADQAYTTSSLVKENAISLTIEQDK